jgi:putative ABC transport system ATP-binding protein
MTVNDPTAADTGPHADASPDAHVVELREVWKRYETGGEIVEALKGVSFAAEPGEFVSVMGPSGSGKSTMLNVLGLLDVPSEGTVLLEGRDVTDLSDAEMTRKRKEFIGFVFQNFHLIPTLSAVENVEVPTLFGADPTAHDRAVALLRRVGLGDRLDHRPDQLSGGQKQRVAIARSLINEPRLLLADEPTGNLDRETGRSVLEEFNRITEEEDVAIVAVTHDQQVSDYADRTIQLVDGRIQSDTSTRLVTGTGSGTGTGTATGAGTGTGTGTGTGSGAGTATAGSADADGPGDGGVGGGTVPDSGGEGGRRADSGTETTGTDAGEDG